MKSGEELSYYLDNEGYNIGDKIKINLSKEIKDLYLENYKTLYERN